MLNVILIIRQTQSGVFNSVHCCTSAASLQLCHILLVCLLMFQLVILNNKSNELMSLYSPQKRFKQMIKGSRQQRSRWTELLINQLYLSLSQMCCGTALNLYLLILVAAAVGVSDFPGVSVRCRRAEKRVSVWWLRRRQARPADL